MSRAHEHSRVIALSDGALAQAVFGPLHRHLAHIQDAFRDEGASRSKPTFRLAIDAQGDEITLRARDAADLDRAEQIINALVAQARERGRVRDNDVLAAISFANDAAGRAPGPLTLPQLGGFTLRTPVQAHYVAAMRDERTDLVFGVGPAGTGKTFLAVAAAVEAVRAGRHERIVVTRPAVEAGEKLGYLPGDFEEKVDPYFQPIWDAFRTQMSEAEVRSRRERKLIEVAPIAFLRGRSLAQAFVIVDEAQNATRLQMKMVLTRLGEGSRMVVTGDPSQTDLPHASDSGLGHALSILDGVPGVDIIRFTPQDVVRHRLVARIIEAYNRDQS
jgi:phosphate starvation-inducible PhoH-like protein